MFEWLDIDYGIGEQALKSDYCTCFSFAVNIYIEAEAGHANCHCPLTKQGTSQQLFPCSWKQFHMGMLPIRLQDRHTLMKSINAQNPRT